jgi:hypothetical protein
MSGNLPNREIEFDEYRGNVLTPNSESGFWADNILLKCGERHH